MDDSALYAQWWQKMTKHGDPAPAIEEWFRSGLIQMTAPWPGSLNGVPFDPLTMHITSIDHVPGEFDELLKMCRAHPPDAAPALRRAIARVVTGWRFRDPDVSEAVALSFDVAGRLLLAEVCDALCRSAGELVQAPDLVLEAVADLGAQLGEEGAALLDYLGQRCLIDEDLHRMVPFFVARRLALCETPRLHAQREAVFDVIARNEAGLRSCEEALDVISAMTLHFVQRMRTAEGQWTIEHIVRLQSMKDLFDNEVLLADPGMRAALRNTDAAAAELKAYARERETAEWLRKAAA